VADVVAALLKLSRPGRSELLLATPKILQALIAAIGDFYTWKLGAYVYGTNSLTSWAVLALTVVSPWQWFFSTRTFSNSLENTLTIVALYNWPWHWSIPNDGEEHVQVDADGLRIREPNDPAQGRAKERTKERTRLRRAILLAGLATILRPTNVLIWFPLVVQTFAWNTISIGPSWPECITFAREGVLCGSTILLLTGVIDRWFYKSWVFPPHNFLHFNVVQSLAVFYGNNDWHYYLSQGYPLLLTTALPFTAIGLYRVLQPSTLPSELGLTSRHVLTSLATVCLFVPAVLSVISHKEVRFMYPLLPALHILTSLPLTFFFGPAITHATTSPRVTPPSRTLKRLLLLVLIAINVTIGYYTTTIHNSGLIALTEYLRHEFETHYLHLARPSNMTVGILMPCHSTPWRSHLQYPPTRAAPGIGAWALTCEPPLNLNATEKANYLDEADVFYQSPSIWLKKNMARRPPFHRTGTHPSPGVFANTQHRPGRMFEAEASEQELWGIHRGRREWPDYLAFFEQLESTLQSTMRGSGYAECARLWNTRWHDDWRRRGDVVVWCLDPARRLQSHTAATLPSSSSWWHPLGGEEEEERGHGGGAGKQKVLGGKDS